MRTLKTCLILFAIGLLPYSLFSQTNSEKIDVDAITLLDQMGETIGELSTVSFHLSTVTTTLDSTNTNLVAYAENEVKMAGPNKMLVKIHGMNKNRGYWYNGDYLTFYSYDENNYITVEAPSDIVSMIHFIHDKFDIDFPAADFFYPSFTDDLIDMFTTISYSGMENIKGTNCFLIQLDGDTMNAKIWIEDTELRLPKQFEIIYKMKHNNTYKAKFSDWYLNPELSDDLFEFVPPDNAKLISVLITKS